MIDFLKIVLAGIVGGVLALGGSAFFPHQSANLESLGASVAANVTTIGNPWNFTNTVTFGSSGSAISKILKGNCALATTTGQTSYTILGSTTAAFDCAVTGALTTDTNIFMQTATSSLASGGGFEVESVSASSTAGYLRVHVRNNTGSSAVLPASVASSSPYLIVR